MTRDPVFWLFVVIAWGCIIAAATRIVGNMKSKEAGE